MGDIHKLLRRAEKTGGPREEKVQAGRREKGQSVIWTRPKHREEELSRAGREPSAKKRAHSVGIF